MKPTIKLDRDEFQKLMTTNSIKVNLVELNEFAVTTACENEVIDVMEMKERAKATVIKRTDLKIDEFRTKITLDLRLERILH